MGTCVIKRNKNYISILIIVCSLVFIGIFGGFLYYKEVTATKLAHISIDDATMILQDIALNEYDSIFDNPILYKLKILHDEYSITATMYVYGQLEEFSIWDMPTNYRKEFLNNSEWLKIGYHSSTESNPQDDYSELRFEEDFDRINSAICRFAGVDSVAHVLRLHYWYATKDMIAYMKQKGIIGLLCNDSEQANYDLSSGQVEKLYKSRDGKLTVDGLTYYVTDIRLENTDNITTTLNDKSKDRIIVIFTHAWCFEENYNKLLEAVRLLSEEGYQFSSLEESSK